MTPRSSWRATAKIARVLVMHGKLGLVVSLALVLGCSGNTSRKQSKPDAAVGGSGGGGDSIADGSMSGTGGTSAGGATTTQGGAGAATNGGGMAGTALGGSATGTGGQATGGTTPGGIGGTVRGGAGGSVGGQPGTSPANDSPGQDPFARPAGSGILITSSDGLNSTDLVLASSSDGGLFLVGATRNPLAMGLKAFDSGVASEAFAARLDAQGKLLWSVPLKACGVPSDVAAGPNNSFFVVCPNEPDATTLMPSTCFATALVEKLSGSDGKTVFEAHVNVPPTPPGGFLCPYGLGVDAQGRSYVAGAYASSGDPAERALLSAVTTSGQQDWTLISDGPTTQPSSDTPVAYANDVDVDSNGNVLLAGGFNGWMKLGTIQLTSQAVLGQNSMYNGFFARVAADGTGPTAWRFGGTVFDMATTIAAISDGGFLLGGWVSGPASIGGKTVTASLEGSAFVAQVNSQGQASWAKVVAGKGMAGQVAHGPDGKAYVVGQFENDEILYIYDPAADTFTAHKTTAGNATANALRTRSVVVSPSGAIWLSGTFEGTINLGTGALSTSTVSAFLIKLN